MQHKKVYKSKGNGVNLLCVNKVVADSPWRYANFSITNCIGCGMDVETIGHSPETDKVNEYSRRKQCHFIHQ